MSRKRPKVQATANTGKWLGCDKPDRENEIERNGGKENIEGTKKERLSFVQEGGRKPSTSANTVSKASNLDLTGYDINVRGDKAGSQQDNSGRHGPMAGRRTDRGTAGSVTTSCSL